MSDKAKRILVIEDDIDILKILCDQLELDGYSARGCTTGEEGVKASSSFKPDLIILDLNLPDIDGIKVCQYVRKRSECPVIMLTARDSLSDKMRGFASGCDDYIVKPFEYLELSVRVKACLRRYSGAGKEAKVLDFNSLKIVPARREVTLGDRPVKLTKKEFDLLELLASFPGQVLEREFITQQLWPNKEVYSWSRALDVHVRRLRQKIEPDPEHPVFIITHPGVGYSFRSEAD